MSTWKVETVERGQRFGKLTVWGWLGKVAYLQASSEEPFLHLPYHRQQLASCLEHRHQDSGELPPYSRVPYVKSMQGIARVVRSHRHTLKDAILKHPKIGSNVFSRSECIISAPTIQHKGLENTTVAEVLTTKGEEKNDSLLCCLTNDTVYDAVKLMADNNVGSLVVLRPGEQKLIAGILTERDYLKKIIAQGRSSKYTRVGEIMTNESKLITVSSDTNILHAMQLMTENHIRHVPVIDGKMVGMISIVDVVRAVVEQQNQEVKRLNEFIKGDYY